MHMYTFGHVTVPLCPAEMCIFLYFVSRNWTDDMIGEEEVKIFESDP